MTFCFIFLARRKGGIGIVSDRRISIQTSFDGWVPIKDDAVKFGMLSSDFGFAFAGSVDTVRLVINALAELPPVKAPSDRLNETSQRISQIYSDLVVQDPVLSGPDSGAILVFFDTYRRHSSQRYRLLQLELIYDTKEKRALVHRNFDRGRDWLAIGANLGVRKHLARCAITDMQEFARRRVRARLATKEEINKISHSPDATSLIFEPGANPPWRELETYRMIRDFGDARMDYTSTLAAVASGAIHWEVKHLKSQRVAAMTTISQEQHVAVFHKAYGLRVSSPGFPE